MKKILFILLSVLITGSLSASDPEAVIYKKVGERELAFHIFKPDNKRPDY